MLNNVFDTKIEIHFHLEGNSKYSSNSFQVTKSICPQSPRRPLRRQVPARWGTPTGRLLKRACDFSLLCEPLSSHTCGCFPTCPQRPNVPLRSLISSEEGSTPREHPSLRRRSVKLTSGTTSRSKTFGNETCRKSEPHPKTLESGRLWYMLKHH